MDTDSSCIIDYTELLAAILDKKAAVKEDVCWQAFRVFDRSGDGKIDKEELKIICGDLDVKEQVGVEALEAIMRDVGQNGDAQIDFQQFMEMIEKMSCGL